MQSEKSNRKQAMNGTRSNRSGIELGHSLDHQLPRFFQNVQAGFAYQRYGCQCCAGWAKLILEFGQELLTYCDATSQPPPAILQIKEKASRLRIVLASVDNTIQTLVDQYEQLSCAVCEICGSPIKQCHCEHS